MSNYNWCHNPNCHTIETQSRVRGSGENKVLRTIKIRMYNPTDPHIYNFFCNQNCLMSYMQEHLQEILKIAPRSKALETPIKIEKEKYERHKYKWADNGISNGYERVPYQATRTIIKSVDND